MSDISGRIYNIAKSYVESARGRIQAIDEAAIAELQSALSGTDMARVDPNAEYHPVSDDPMARAASKIAAAKARARFEGFEPTAAAATESATSMEQKSVPEQLAALEQAAAPKLTASNPVSTAYRIIGIPDGSDRTAIEDAVRKLRERCAPDRFNEGSPERQEALKILARIDEAYTLLMRSFNVEASRFDKLEL